MASFLDNSSVPWWAEAAQHVPKSAMLATLGPPGLMAMGAASMIGGDDPASLESRRRHGLTQRAALRGTFNTPGQFSAMEGAPGAYHPPAAGLPPLQAPPGNYAPPNRVQGATPPPMMVPPPGPPPQGPQSPWWMQAANGMSPQVYQRLRGQLPGAPPPQPPEAPPGPPMSLAPPNPGPSAPPAQPGFGFNVFGPIGNGMDSAVNNSAELVKKFYTSAFGS